MLRRIGVLVSLAVVAAMFAGVSTASAQDTAGACIFTGLSGTLTPGIEPIQGDSLLPDVEQGNYNFATAPAAGGLPDAVCAGVFKGQPALVLDAGISSLGSYDNVYCGTGFAHDLDGNGTNAGGVNVLNGSTVGIGPNFPGSGKAGYEIPFVAGAGPLIIGGPFDGTGTSLTETVVGAINNIDAAHSGAQQDPYNIGVQSDYVGAGAVSIVPEGAPAPAGLGVGGDCIETSKGLTKQFKVTGFFAGVGPGL